MSVIQRTRLRALASPTGGDSAAFARLYTDFFDSIYGYCYSRLGDAFAAEDATATVFSRALAAGPRYDDPSLRSWLFGIAHNVLVNRYRAARPHVPLDEAADVADGQQDLGNALVDEEERERLLLALKLLPDDQRRVVELRMHGLKGTEIAEVLGRTPGAVKMLQLRAFSRLRDLLTEDEFGTETHRHG